MDRTRVHGHVRYGALALAAAMLPWSEFLLSNALIVLLVNWLWEGLATRTLGQRTRAALTDPIAAIWVSFFVLHLLGLAWSSDLAWGVDLCRILLPVPILALVLGSSPRMDERGLNAILLLGAWSALASTIACIVLRWDAFVLGDHRALSPFISHMRLGLMLCFAIAVLLLRWPQRPIMRLCHVAGILWAGLFLLLLGGVAAWLILLVVLLWMAMRGAARLGRIWRAGAWVALIGTVMVLGMVTHRAWSDYDRPAEDLDTLPLVTAGGEAYFHDRERPLRANGRNVWINLADGELGRAWDRRSGVPYAGRDARGQLVKGTLVRYMTSLGLRKDSLGVVGLSDEDVRRIEQGIASADVGRVHPLRTRLEEVFYEIGSYRAGGDANAHSVTMRIEYLRVGWGIALDNIGWGVGTGDTQRAFDQAYLRGGTTLRPEWRLRAHDQFLTWWISFGAVGMTWCLFAWWWPAWRGRAARRPLFVAWALIAVLSFLTEDTLETQMGATFVALYYGLFVLAAPIMPRSCATPVPGRSA